MRNLLLITLAIFTLIGCGNLRDTEENNITNDNAPIITKTIPTLKSLSISIDENVTSKTKVGEITVNDGGDIITSIVLTGEGKSNFNVSKTGTITTSIDAILDYESTPSYNLKAIATNSIGSSNAVNVNISINDINETKIVIPQPTSDSIYLEEVDIPEYDPNDPTHVLITPENGNWTSSVLNDPDYKHFYIEPGKYIAKMNLTASGTENERRTLSLYNGNDIHPAALPDGQVADVRFYFNGASYWMIDRMVNKNSISSSEAIGLRNSSSNNIFNRIYIRNFNNGLYIYGGGDGNVIQNSRFANMSLNAPDGVALGLTWGKNKETSYTIKNTRIVNNEFYNCSDSIQLVRRNRPSDNALQDVNYEGTIIDNNIMYIDNKIYTNGYGKLDPNGFYALAENAIDIKSASNNQNNPVLVTNNKMWGYRMSDNLPSGARSDHGSAIVIHFGTQNVKINNNIIFDSAQGIVAGAKNRFDYSLGNSEIINNIFYNVGAFSKTGDNYGAIMLWSASNVQFKQNTIVNARVKSMWGKATVFDVSFVENVIIDSAEPYNETPSKNRFDYNHYYNASSSGYASGVNDVVFATATEAKMGDYRFTYDKFTANPKQKTLKGIITTKDSPHYSSAGSTIIDSDAAVEYPQLLFKSEFKNDVEVAKTLITGKYYKTHLIGADAGYSWAGDFPGNSTKNIFNFLVNDVDNLTDYVDVALVEAGVNTKALRLEYKANDPSTSANSRVQYNAWAKQGALLASDRFEQIYIKYRIKTNFTSYDKNWRYLMEWRTANDEQAWVLVMEKIPNTNEFILRWHANKVKNGSKQYPNLWSIKSPDGFVVPQDKWFDLEVFWKLSPNEGQNMVAVDGELIISHLGANKLERDMKVWNPFKVYGAKGVSLITNLEIWNNIPENSILKNYTVSQNPNQ